MTEGGSRGGSRRTAPIPRLRRGRAASATVAVLLAAAAVRTFVGGDVDWAVVGRFLFAPAIIDGLVNTVAMTVVAMALAVVLGVVAAVMRLSSDPVLSAVSAGYVWLFRGVPALVQLLLWYNLALFSPTLGIPGVFSVRTVAVMTPFVATALALGIGQGAYTAEVVRGGLLSVDEGQYDAARVLGLKRMQTFRHILLPQAMRVILPPVGNEVISMAKLTSLASVIQYPSILRSAEIVSFANGRVLELLLVASFWYLAIVSALSLVQGAIERRAGRSGRGARTPARGGPPG